MAEEKFSNFLTDIIDADLAEGKVDVVHTRFPPEPNGYLHIGSAKAIFINYTIAKHYGGLFNLRFDDTNPAREGDEYVQSILQDLKWLGAEPNGGIFYGSDYFERCYEYAEQLIKEGKAYVDDLTREQMQEYRGNDAGKPSRPSPYRDRTPEENLDLLEKYDVDYIYVSSYERSSYAVDTDTLDRLFTRVFSNWEATIYAVHPSSETEDMGNGASAALRGGA